MSRIREKEAELTDYKSLMSQRRPRRAMYHVSARPSAERQKISPSGISLRPPNVSSPRLRTALQTRSPPKCCATMLSCVASTQTIRSRCCSRRRRGARWLSQLKVESTRDPSSPSLKRKAIAIRLTQATCLTCTRTLLFDQSGCSN